MQALRVQRSGHAEITLDANMDVPQLDPKSEHMLVRVLTCALNAGDAKFLSGALRSAAHPYTPGLEVCGVVEAMGAKTAAAGTFKVGDRVVAALRPPQTAAATALGGGLAQYVVVEAVLAAVVPPNVSAEAAVALPLAGAMALQVIKDAAITTNSRVLVLGASSDVGRLVVQLAKHAGASFVAGTTPRKDLVAALPLDHAIVDDNQQPKWYEVLRDAEKIHVVVDCIGESDSWRHADKVLSTGATRGVFAVLLSELISAGDVKATTQLLTLGFVSMWKSFWRAKPKLLIVGQFPSTATLQALLTLVETKELTPALDASTPLAFTPEAIQHGLTRLTTRQQTGKLVVQILQTK